MQVRAHLKTPCSHESSSVVVLLVLETVVGGAVESSVDVLNAEILDGVVLETGNGIVEVTRFPSHGICFLNTSGSRVPEYISQLILIIFLVLHSFCMLELPKTHLRLETIPSFSILINFLRGNFK